MIKYLGSKRVLVPRILAAIGAIPQTRRVLDLFCGTARVGHALKRAGYYVIANDHLAYAATLGRCYVQADAKRLQGRLPKIIEHLSGVEPCAGYFTETFCVRSRFFHPRNGERIDGIREEIERLGLDPVSKAVVLVSLMEAADRVDSTTGVQMAYLKTWAARALKPLELRMPAILAGPGEAHQLDAEDAAALISVDVAYLDPPYNQHRYLGNYHIWESLALWDKPSVYGIACKRVDCRDYKSGFNSRPGILPALVGVLNRLKSRWTIVSFNNEGYIDQASMTSLLMAFGHVEAVEVDFKRYVGAQIGIHNPQGIRVGTVSHVRNKEYLYFVGPEREVLRRMAEAAQLGPATEQLGLFGVG